MADDAGTGEGGSFIGGEGAGNAAAAGGTPAAGAPAAGDAGGDGAGTPAVKWQDSLPEEIRNEASLRRYADPSEAHKAYVSLEKKMGGDPTQFIKRPGENPTPEVLAEFHTALGRPENADAYAFPKVDGGDLEVDGEYAKDFRNALFAAGVSSTQATSIYSAIIAADTAQAARIENAGFNEISAKLTAEWGENFAANKALAERALATFSKETRGLLKMSGLNNDAGFVSKMAIYGATMAEHGAPGGGGGGIGDASPEEAKRAFQNFITNKDNAEIMRKTAHPDHRAKSEEYTALVQAMGHRDA